jgi:hypothetical protein
MSSEASPTFGPRLDARQASNLEFLLIEGQADNVADLPKHLG